MTNLSADRFAQVKGQLVQSVATTLDISSSRIDMTLASGQGLQSLLETALSAVSASGSMATSAQTAQATETRVDVTIKDPPSGSNEKTAEQAEKMLESEDTSKLTKEIQKF